MILKLSDQKVDLVAKLLGESFSLETQETQIIRL